MTFEAYMAASEDGWPRKGSVGKISEWYDIGELTVSIGPLCVVDPMLFNAEDGVSADVPAGEYDVRARGINFDGHRRVSALRLQLSGAVVRRGDLLREAGVDMATIVAVDIGDFDKRFDMEWADDLSERVFDLCAEAAGVTAIELHGVSFPVAVANTGLGDGAYPVYALIEQSGERIVGLEVEFLPDQYVMEHSGG